MANLNVTYEELTTQASNLKAGEEELMSTLNRLQGQVNQLISAGFQTDKASGAFGTSYEQFTKGAKETISGLEGPAVHERDGFLPGLFPPELTLLVWRLLWFSGGRRFAAAA